MNLWNLVNWIDSKKGYKEQKWKKDFSSVSKMATFDQKCG